MDICQRCKKPLSERENARITVSYITKASKDSPVLLCDKCFSNFESFINGPIEVKTNIFDEVEMYSNCTVQVLTNTVTGEVSVGWWPNETE